MPRILMWTGADISDLQSLSGLACIVTEVDDEGTVTREIGFDAQGKIIHRFPGEMTIAKYGVFDLAKIAPSRGSDMNMEEFERLWSS